MVKYALDFRLKNQRFSLETGFSHEFGCKFMRDSPGKESNSMDFFAMMLGIL
jgi:hypothetical protein